MKRVLLLLTVICCLLVVGAIAQGSRGDLFVLQQAQASQGGILLDWLYVYKLDPVQNAYILVPGTFVPLPMKGATKTVATTWEASFHGMTWRPILVVGWTQGAPGPYKLTIRIGKSFSYSTTGQQGTGVTYLQFNAYSLLPLFPCSDYGQVVGAHGVAHLRVEFSGGEVLAGNFKFTPGPAPTGEAILLEPIECP